MSIYNMSGNMLSDAYGIDGMQAEKAYNITGQEIYSKGLVLGQEYIGGYIEIQPDSWDGVTAVDGNIVQPGNPTAWGFPMSLSTASKASIKSDILNGVTGIRYIRFPMGFAYRGYRNIDASTGLAKNIGERWAGQNNALREWFSNIAQNGGGLAPEYWCIAPYWLTGGAYSAINNQINAGGNYPRSKPLKDIKTSDPTQYNAQIDAFTDAVVDDMIYLEENIAPVVMFSLSNEPSYGTMLYGACMWDAQTYNDVFSALIPKLKAEFPQIKLHAASSDEIYPFSGIASTFIANNSANIWGYSHHSMRKASGEVGNGADEYYKSNEFATMVVGKENVFINEYEYFDPDNVGDDNFKCSNSMVHLIDEMVYGKAEVLHPIIHICKPTGQSATSTNTKGYCLYQVDMNDGSYTVNTWAYNSWKMFNDNLPIGAKLVKNYFVDVVGIGFMTLIKNEKLYVFVANSTSEAKTLNLGFFGNKTFDCKLYNMSNLGSVIAQSDNIGTLTIPAYSGICCIEN